MREFACLMLFLFAAPVCGAGSSDPLASLRWAERVLAHSSFQYQLSHGWGAQWDLRDAEEAFKRILLLGKFAKQSGRAWAGLARAQAGLGKYDKATSSYENALALLPGHRALTRELRLVRDQRAVAQAAQARLPEGEAVLQALPYSVRSTPDLWAVLSARVKWPTDAIVPPSWPEIDRCRLTILQGKPKSLKRVWRSCILGYPGHTDGEFNYVYLYVADVTGDGQPDLVLPKTYCGGSWSPSHVDIFTWRGGSAAHLLGAVGDDEIRMGDLNHDGRYEVITNHAVGECPCHALQPRWLFIYSYRNGTYQLAERGFPNQYRDLYREIKAKLRQYPNDFELLYYYARCCEIRRMPRTALSAYRRAVKEGRSEEDAPWVSHILCEARRRIRVLGGLSPR